MKILLRSSSVVALLTCAFLSVPGGANHQETPSYVADIEFALDAVEEQCGRLIESKEIDWKRVRKEFLRDAKQVSSDEEHHLILRRLLARLEDGHSAVRSGTAGREIGMPEEPEQAPFGLFLCRSGKQLLVKRTFGQLAGGVVKPGWEVAKIDGQKAEKWIEDRIAERSDRWSFSTAQHAFFNTCHWGLSGELGSRIDVEFKTDKRKKKQRTLTLEKAKAFNPGPAVFPENTTGLKDVNYAELEDDLGYIHLRRCKSDLIEQLDQALQSLQGMEGLVLDFRGNSGGGHFDALIERLLPPGQEHSALETYTGSGEHPFTGPVVAIIDAGTVSASETMSGMLKENGRAYLIGDTPTAGMSSSKTTIDLPSGLFSLYVSVASNKHRYNEGRGIEGIGIAPHEIVEYDQEDLIEGRDTLIERAVELLLEHPDGDFPDETVSYRPPAR